MAAADAPAAVVGLGHVGLPLAVWWAERSGPPVVGFDREPRVIADLKGGYRGPEPGLAERLAAVLASGRLRLTAEPPSGPRVVALCVPTPITDTRTADLSALEEAVAAMSPRVAPGTLWLVSSTVPVGTTGALASQLRRVDPTCRVAMCPERVWPGRVMHEIVHVSRVVGGVDPASTEAARAWFAERSEGRVAATTAPLAELTKLVENASRDAELAVSHAAAELARDHGLDPYALQQLVNAHPRARMWTPGVGVGGHCLPVDPWFLVRPGSAAGELFAAVRSYADGIPARWVDRILALRPPPARVAVLGIAYKPDSADVRNAPALALARGLAQHYEVVVVDPRAPVPGDLVAVDIDEALDADVVVLAVAHAAWRDRRPRARAGQLVVDACGGWRAQTGSVVEGRPSGSRDAGYRSSSGRRAKPAVAPKESPSGGPVYTRLLLLRAVTLPLRLLPGRGRLLLEPIRRASRRCPGTVVINDFDGDVKFELELGADVDSAVYWYGAHDPALLAWLRAAVRPGDTVVDVGPGVGEATLLAAKLVGASGRGVAVEIDEVRADRLRRNLALNGFDYVDVLKTPLGEVELAGDAGRESSSVDALLDEGWFGEVNVLRIAHEEPLAVLEGATQVLESSRPFVVLEASVGAGQPGREALALLERADYRIYTLDGGGRSSAVTLAGLSGEHRLVAGPSARPMPGV